MSPEKSPSSPKILTALELAMQKLEIDSPPQTTAEQTEQPENDIDDIDYVESINTGYTIMSSAEQDGSEQTNSATYESKIGNTLLSATDRISSFAEKVNEKLVNGVEKRAAAKQKLQEIGRTTLSYLVNGAEVTLGLGIMGAEALSRGIENTTEKVKTQYNTTKSDVKEKYDLAKDAASERIVDFKNSLQVKRLLAQARKAERLEVREKRKERQKIEYAKLHQEWLDHQAVLKDERDAQKVERQEKAKAKMQKIGQSALNVIDRAQVTGKAGAEAWRTYKPEQKTV